ncbi:MAG TPA: DUF2029 domain-containing protein [Planctomycetes bacterium]|nr:DUF2029 domain-containing protein [Planctomycetota bacterium]
MGKAKGPSAGRFSPGRGPLSFLPWLVLAGILVFLFARGIRRGPTFDFLAYLEAGKAVASGGSLYGAEGQGGGFFLYSPAFAVLFSPLASMDPKRAYWFFHLSSLGAFALSLLSLGLVFRRSGVGVSLPWVLAGAGLLVLYPLASNFKHGNTNSFILLLFCLSLHAYAAGRPFLGGLPLSLAVGFKVTPILFLPWLILRKRRRETWGFLGGLVFWMVLLPAAVLGPARAYRETRSWVSRIVLPAAFSKERIRPRVLEESGESLPRITHALLAGREEGAGKTRRKGLTPSLGILSRKQAKVLGYGIAIFVILATLLLTRGEPGPGEGGFGLVAAAALLASPVSRAAHFVLLLPLAAWLFRLALSGEDEEKRRRAWARFALGAGILFMVLSILAAKTAGFPSKTFFPDAWLALPLWAGGLFLVPRNAHP